MTKVRISTAMGDIVAELRADIAPVTVANFLAYVQAGAYDGGSFHRSVTPETSANEHFDGIGDAESGPNGDVAISVIQAEPSPECEDGTPIRLEDTRSTGLSHLNGTLSMGRTAPTSATSAFFICVGDQPELDFGGRRNRDRLGFAAFGHVVVGMDVVRRVHDAPARGQQLDPIVRIAQVRVIG